MTRPTLIAAALAAEVLLAGALLGGCQGPPPSRHAAASPTEAAACRERADAVYAKQNRAELYRSDTYATDNRDSPFANSGLPGVTTSGLSGRYARDNLIAACLGGDGGAAASAGPAPSTALPPTTP